MTEDDEVLFNFRVPRRLHDQFLDICDANDDTASRLMRKFMRSYIQQHAQTDLEQLIRRAAKKSS
jgi:hypothetical protein